MITIFNRKELFITYSIPQQAALRTLLSQNHIDYQLSTLGNQMRNFRTGNRWGNRTWENPNVICEYKFYVRKKDFDRACLYLNQLPKQ